MALLWYPKATCRGRATVEFEEDDDTSMDMVNCAHIEDLLGRVVVNKGWFLPQSRNTFGCFGMQ